MPIKKEDIVSALKNGKTETIKRYISTKARRFGDLRYQKECLELIRDSNIKDFKLKGHASSAFLFKLVFFKIKDLDAVIKHQKIRAQVIKIEKDKLYEPAKSARSSVLLFILSSYAAELLYLTFLKDYKRFHHTLDETISFISTVDFKNLPINDAQTITNLTRIAIYFLATKKENWYYYFDEKIKHLLYLSLLGDYKLEKKALQLFECYEAAEQFYSFYSHYKKGKNNSLKISNKFLSRNTNFDNIDEHLLALKQ